MPTRRKSVARTRTRAGAAPATLTINRAPVLTLWAAVVAERLGYDWDAAVTLGRSVAGRNAALKARTLGIGRERDPATKKRVPERKLVRVELCGREVPAIETPEGLRATSEGRATTAESAHRYLEGKFGEALPAVRAAMTTLARSMSPEDLAADAYALYEDFRPAIPRGVRGWGAAGVLDLDRIRALAAASRRRGEPR
jgi:hypothetical protein